MGEAESDRREHLRHSKFLRLREARDLRKRSVR
jgi:hypothetical protein